jgi:hypothetical protein
VFADKRLCAQSFPFDTQEPKKTCQSFIGSGCRSDDYCVSHAFLFARFLDAVETILNETNTLRITLIKGGQEGVSRNG